MTSPSPSLSYSILSYLSDPSLSSSLSPEKKSKLESSIKDLSEALSLDLNDPSTQAKYGGGPGLQTIYQVFERTQKKMGGGQEASTSSPTPAPAAATSAPVPEPTEAAKAEAETLKAAGNKSMTNKDYGGAISNYTEAIQLSPKNPVYYSNRAAAYSQIGQHDKAIEDANEAIKCDAKFGKAYSRLGHALFASGKFSEAAGAYQRGLEIDPGNSVLKSGLETSRSQAAAAPTPNQNESLSRGAPGGGAGAGGNPMAGLAGLMGGMGGGGGGMPDLGALLNNPAIMQMAQQMMGNGGMEQIMNNPMMRQMAERMQSGGGMPDMGAIQNMMQDPQMQNLARQFGGAGGAGGRTGNDDDEEEGNNGGMYS